MTLHITLTPPDGSPQEWDYDLRRITTAEMSAVEHATGLSGLKAFQEALNNWSASALQALVWIARKRQDPTLRYEAVDFPIADLTITEDEAVPKEDEGEPSASQASPSDAGG